MKKQLSKFIALGFLGATMLVACNSNSNNREENRDTVTTSTDYPTTDENSRRINGGSDTIDTTSIDTLGTGVR